MPRRFLLGFPAAVACAFALTVASPQSAQAQGFLKRLKNIAEEAAKSEIEGKVDEEARHATRCAMGDEQCALTAKKNGEEVVYFENDDAGGDAGVYNSADPGGDHPLIVPYQGSQRTERKYDDYNEYERVIGWKNKTNLTERLEGTLTRLRYANPGGRSTFEIISNYRNALTAKGFQVDYECSKRDKCGNLGSTTAGTPGWYDINGMNLGIGGDIRYFTGKMAYGNGTAYVSVGVNPGLTYVHVLETTAMDTGMVGVTAEGLASGLEQSGKVTLDGLYFDTGRATLTADSNPSLDQAALLMQQQPTLNLLVVGHTDSTGNAASNMTLSQQRAEAVRNALLARGVAASRLVAQGVGSSVPVASNDTEEGRAQNRRVELVKQ